MCVIAVKKSGVDLPNDDLINSMWNTNSHGAGFMYTYGGKVFIEKGFMNLDDLRRAINELKTKVDTKETPIIFHFRITTHGGTSPQNTHPFPISSDDKHLRALDLSCSLGVVHNGIIDSVDVPKGSTMSDTMHYVQDVLSPLSMLNKAFYKNNFGKTLMENQIGWSKLAFLDKSGNIELVGDFKTSTKDSSKGLLFSNLNHELSKGVYSYKSYDWHDSDYALPFSTSDENVKVKPLKKGTYVEYYNKGTKKNDFIMIQIDDYYYVDEYNFVYAYSYATKTLTESFYEGAYVLSEDGKDFVELDYATHDYPETEMKLDGYKYYGK